MPDSDTFCSSSTQGPFGVDWGSAKASGERIKKKTNANTERARILLVIFYLLCASCKFSVKPNILQKDGNSVSGI
jgi:hypothetical protein